MSSHRRQSANRTLRAFTLTELLVVIAVIIVLLGLLTPALTGVWKSGQLTKSSSSLRQIALWMQAYSSDNRDFIVPAYFDYSDGQGTGIGGSGSGPSTKVRKGTPRVGEPYVGTWTDILWTQYATLDIPDVDADGGSLQSYRFDSPDHHVYDSIANYVNPFRSSAKNTRNTQGVTAPSDPVPFGEGATEQGLPGYFAANMSFDSTGIAHEGYLANGEIRAPARVLYLVDSFVGETIGPRPDGSSSFEEAFLIEPTTEFSQDGGPNPNVEVDFRYGDLCLMLFLDGHVGQQSPWTTLRNLQQDREVKVTDVTNN
jgi:type II secretory pathway pseudopilin PulG